MQGLYFLLFVSGLAALPWLGLKFGGRLLIAGLALAEVVAITGFTWSLRTADIASCGGDELCISEMIGWFDNIALLLILFLLGIVGTSAYVACVLTPPYKGEGNDYSELRKVAH